MIKTRLSSFSINEDEFKEDEFKKPFYEKSPKSWSFNRNFKFASIQTTPSENRQ